MSASNSLGPVSLVIAITGHRDLNPDDFPWYEAEIAGIFRELRAAYPHTPLVLLSALAEGGDRIAVRAAMKLKSELGISLVAVLPMPDQVYRRSFKTSESNAEFDAMVGGALRCIQLPQRSGDTEEDQYERLGRFLVSYSQILIAILDQDRVMRRGGTAHVVSMKLRLESSQGGQAFERMNAKGAGPVYVLAARGVGSGTGFPPALKREIRYPESSSPQDYESSYQLLDQFNEDVGEADSLSAAIEQSRRDLFEGAEAIGLSDAMQWVTGVYARADALAIHFAAVSLLLWQCVFVFIALAGIGLAWLHSLGGGSWVLKGYYACLITAFALGFWERKAKRRQRHEDYRALAEALRVQFFWLAAGLKDLASEQYLRKQAGEMVWIRDAMTECGLFDDVLDHRREATADRAARLRLTQTWVEGQSKYFRKTEHRHERKQAILSGIAWLAAGVGFVSPAVGLLYENDGGKVPYSVEVSHAVAAIAMFLAALVWNYIERRGFAQEARQYGRMYELFHATNEDLKAFERVKNYDAADATIRELGLEALAENGDWLSMHRERKLSAQIAAG